MKHYYHPMSRAVTVDWMLKELGVDHEQIVIDYPSGENKTPEYRAINPMAKVPTLVDGDIVVTETAAICAYLADKYPDRQMAPPIDSPSRGAYYRYLFFPGTTLEPLFTTLQMGTTDYSPESVGFGDLDRCLATLEVLTPDSNWALGDTFTAADIVFGGTLDFSVQFGWLSSPTDKVRNYVQRIKARPAYRSSHDPSWY